MLYWSIAAVLASDSQMDNEHDSLDIAIAGGGPAGAAAATFLARCGYRVGLVTLPTTAARIEGMSPRVHAVLQANGLPLCGVQPATQRHVSWGAFQGAQNVEHLVCRNLFDQGMINQARIEGVTIWTGVISSLSAKQGVIRLKDGRAMTARLLFEARGRRAPSQATKAQARHIRMGPDTVSIASFVKSHASRSRGSKIIARPEGWVWRAQLEDGWVWQQVVTDARAHGAGRDRHKRLQTLWTHGIGGGDRKDASPKLIDEDIPQWSKAVVSACALRLNAHELDPRCPRLGDAAVALDPLSGHGIFWAISSALMAPLLARAIFDGELDLAREFYRHRVVDTFWRQARVGRDFHKESGQNGAFWMARKLWPDQAPSHPPIAHPRRMQRVISVNGRLTRGDVLVTAFEPGGAGFVLGQPLGPILDALGSSALPSLHDFRQQIVPHLAPPLAAQLHDWLTTRGLDTGPAIYVQNPEEEKPTCDTRPAA